jgi:hypothetical protein
MIPQMRPRDVTASDEEQEINLKRTKVNSESSQTSITRKGTMLDVFVEGGRQQALSRLKEDPDNALLLFVVCNTLPPNVIDSREFKYLVKVLNSDYVLASATTFADNLVPAVIAHLKTCRNLTISAPARPSYLLPLYVTPTLFSCT